MKLLLALVALFALSQAIPLPPSEDTWDYRVVESFNVASLKTGQVVEVVYKTPNSGRVSINFRTAGGDYAFQADARINVFSYRNVFSLYTFTDLTGWSKEQDVEGYPFTCPPVTTTVTVHITVQEDGYLVTVNDIDLATFSYHENLTPDLVTVIECGLGDSSAPIQGSVEKISVSL